MKPAPFTLHTPRSLPQALRIKSQLGSEGTLLAGGQSLIALMNFRVAQPKDVITLARVSEFKTITITDRFARIGSGMTYSDVIRAATGGTLPRPFRDVLSNIASEPIRNKGTVGGALAQADPKAELPALCLALDAEVVLASTAGARVVPASAFFHGYMDTDARDDEVIAEVRFDRTAWNETWFGYSQVAQRQGDYAEASVLASYRTDAGGRVEHPIVVSMKQRSYPCQWRDLMDHLAGVEASPQALRAAADTYFDGEPADHSGPDRALTRSVLVQAMNSAERI